IDSFLQLSQWLVDVPGGLELLESKKIKLYLSFLEIQDICYLMTLLMSLKNLSQARMTCCKYRIHHSYKEKVYFAGKA
ncbi:MAG: hypothetical protein QG556_702, partial [Pseudomonadota bacterium]|nr:hypothetical protein [Pseudomonadota bacterium]